MRNPSGDVGRLGLGSPDQLDHRRCVTGRPDARSLLNRRLRVLPLRFPRRRVSFVIILGTLPVLFESILIPMYLMVSRLGLGDSCRRSSCRKSRARSVCSC